MMKTASENLGAMGNQMSRMMNSVNNPAQSPPPLPMSSYFIALNGQQSGQFNLNELKQMTISSQFTKSHHAWKEGMSYWKLAESVAELTGVLDVIPPPPPTI